MSKSEIMTLEGVVTERLPNALFKVLFENGHTITATISGKIRKNNINILKDDRVDVELTPYDLDKGRIVYRYR
jgi:translation initiation factor IF-1|tara:strand:+ start:222 stop:440 length:219 start_codon:yes stop_codon:yes gene_type:complete